MKDSRRPSCRRFLDAAACRPVDRPPVWMMRQAGRYLPEYREVRGKLSFFELCEDVGAAVEVSLQPFRRFSPDGVVMFSDILVPVRAMGAQVAMDDGGPKLASPVRSEEDVERLSFFEPSVKTPYVLEILTRLKKTVGDSAAVLGFAGAPWTLACYLVEGGGSKSFAQIKTMMTRAPRALRALLTKLEKMVADYLLAQLDAGADAVQLFDTWAGDLSPEDYREFALPYARDAIARVRKKGKPVIYFVNGISGILESAAETGADVISVDWRCGLSEARRRLPRRVLQGNLDPAHLLGSPEGVSRRVSSMIREAGPAGHIANLGHGVLPQTPLECVEAFFAAARGAQA
jgi:uroporphyrinogen decarboxylase